MEAALENDNWKHWFRLHGPKLLLCARLWTRSPADAEDVVQEAFIRFWRGQRQLGGDPLPLLITSVRRAAIDRGRGETRRRAREERSGLEPAESAPLFEPDERGAGVESALEKLPAEQREVLVLKIWGGLTFDQVAQQLEIPPNTAASRYRYALAAIRREIAECGLRSADCKT